MARNFKCEIYLAEKGAIVRHVITMSFRNFVRSNLMGSYVKVSDATEKEQGDGKRGFARLKRTYAIYYR